MCVCVCVSVSSSGGRGVEVAKAGDEMLWVVVVDVVVGVQWVGGWLISRVRGVTLERWNVNAMLDLYWPYLWKSGNGT